MAQYTYAGGHGQESQDILQQQTSFETPASLENSQQSSLNTINSQLFKNPSASSGLLDSFIDSFVPVSETPSTSSSNMSSQERAETAIADEEDVDLTKNGNRLPPHLQPIEPAASSPLGHSVHPTGAPKRMANGDMKSPGYSLPTSPASTNQYGHSRNSSRTSRGSQIGELSSQLKTRLSYAMVKVQHGWQSHNISELEHLTSNQGSPVSAGQDHQRTQASSLTKNLSADNQQLLESSLLVSGLMAQGDSTNQEATSTPIYRGHQDGGGKDMNPIPRVSATYDSFWRENEGSCALRAKKTGSLASVGPSLAPPVDIVPRNPRRLESTNRQLPVLHTNNLRNPESQYLPKTPSPKKMRTPSQQAAVEKDAVESLIFMSSPGNSAYHPPAALLGTPLRNEFSPPGFTPHAQAPIKTQSKVEADVPRAVYQSEKPQPRKPLANADIDKMLDDMPDTSSSDDEDS